MRDKVPFPKSGHICVGVEQGLSLGWYILLLCEHWFANALDYLLIKLQFWELSYAIYNNLQI